MADGSLQKLYEDPATPLAAGYESARMQGTVLAAVASSASRRLLVADVGCGDGSAAAVLREVCAQTPGADVRFFGVDWSLTALEQARRKEIPVVRGSVIPPGLPIASDSLDVVIMSEIIEHLVDTDAALKEAWRVLAPGGTLLMSTPNLAAWYNRALLVLGVQPVFTEVSLEGIYGRPGTQVVGHLRIFTKRALVGLLGANGFVDVTVAGGPYHDVPRPFRGLDRLLCRAPALSSILRVSARKASDLAT